MMRIIKLSGLYKVPINEDDALPPNDSSQVNRDLDNGENGVDPADTSAEMGPKATIMKINDMTADLYNQIQVDDGMEEWVVQKLRDAHDLVNSVHGHISYEQKKPDSLPQSSQHITPREQEY